MTIGIALQAVAELVSFGQLTGAVSSEPVCRVLQLMERFLADDEVQAAGCRAIRSLSFAMENKAVIVTEGGLKALFEAMDAHIGSAKYVRIG